MAGIFIDSSDICKIFDVKQRQSYNKIRFLRDVYGKKNFSPITIEEFCNYYDLDINKIKQLIR